MNITKKRSLPMTIAIIITALIAALLIFASTKPDTFIVERSITVNAASDKVFPLVNDFHAWTKWSPWEKKDPAMKRIYSGPDSGTGAIYAWEGNNSVGRGKMTITQSVPFSQILIALDFIAPFAAQHTTEFTFTPQGEATLINWTMKGSNNFFSKLMQVFMSMDTMVGKDFEAGLQQLKTAAENRDEIPE